MVLRCRSSKGTRAESRRAVSTRKVHTGDTARGLHRASLQRLGAPGKQLISMFGGPGRQDGRLEGVLAVGNHPDQVSVC